MAYSNRVSLDTDVIFLRTIFAFSTNNVPVSTNFIMAAGCNGQIIASDALRTLETYGIGYLPCTFSTFDGEILSVSLTVLSTGVTNTMLYSTQNFLLSNICTVQSNVEILSSYVLENVIPSSFSTVNQEIIQLNSSFEGYIVSQAVTPAQLFSTTSGLIDYTDASTSNLSTSVDTQFQTYSNYVAATYTPLTTFSNFSTSVSTTFSDIYGSISTTNSNYVALSNYTRVTVGNLSTSVTSLSNQVIGLSNTFNSISSTSQNPFFVIGVQSTMQNVFFGSNIQVSSITSNIYLRGGNVGIANTNPTTRLDVSGSAIIRGDFAVNSNIQVSSITSNIYLRSGNVGIGTNNPTSRLDVSGSATISGNLAVDTNTLYVDAANNRVGIVNATPSYPLDVTGDINFTGTLRQNGAPYGGGGTTNVLGILSTTNQVYFGSNITASTINVGSATLFASNGFVGLGTTTPTTALDVSGAATVRGGLIVDTNTLYVNATTNRVGILCNAPGYALDVAGTGRVTDLLISSTVDMPYHTLYVIDPLGTVGINTNAPAYTFDVSGDINFTGTLYQNGTPFSGGGATNVLGTLSTTNQVYFGSNITASTINVGSGTLFASNGVVGLGTTVPATALDVSGSTTVRGDLIVDTNTLYVNATTNRVGILCNAPGHALDIAGTARAIDLLISSTVDMPYHTLYAVDPLGTVGINTNAPGYALDVVGDINFTGTLRQNGNPYSGGGGGSANVLGTLSVANQVYFGSNITLSTMNLGSGTLFASNGFVGVGTTTPILPLDVSGSAIIRGSFAINSNIQVSSITNNIYLQSGNVGIGTNNPTSKLDVSGGANITGNLAVDTNTLYVDAANNRVGIINATPGYPLDVTGDINFTGTLRQNGTPYGGTTNVLGTLSAANQVYFGSNIRLSTMNLGSGTLFGSNGVVGIGTTTPATTLDVSGSGIIRGDFAVNSNIQVSSITSNIYMRSGNVGIGTNNPASKLDVSGGAIIRGLVGIGTASPAFALDVSGSLQVAGRIFSKAGTAADPVFANIDDFNQDTGLYYPGAGQLSITNDGTEGYRFTGTALYALCNAFEAVGNGSNKSIVIDPVDTSGGNPYVLVRTSIDDTAYGVPSIELQTPSLTIKQFAVPTTGAGFAQNNAYNVYTYPTAGGVNLAYVIDASGRMGIGGTTAANTALNVTGVVNITSNLAVDTNVLYADAVNNRVGISCNTPSYVLDVNGDTNLNGRIFSQNGNASAPAFGSVNDQDTGLYFPSDGQISFATNSAERGRINGNGLAMLCNAIEAVGYNSNRGVILDGGGTSAVGDTTLTLRTNSSNANTDGKPYITMQVSSLMMRQFLNPAAGTGLLKNRALNTYVYNTGGGDTYLSYIIDASGQMGIAGDTTADTALTVNGAANITSNLIVDTNTLYVNAGTNRVGVLCNSPSYTLDVNGALNVASNLSTTMLNVSTVNSLVSTPKQILNNNFSNIASVTIGNPYTNPVNTPLFTLSTNMYSQYNLINLSFNVYSEQTSYQGGGNKWFTIRTDTESITNTNTFLVIPQPVITGVTGQQGSDSFNYYMMLNRDFKRTDKTVQFIIDNVSGDGGENYVSLSVYLTYFSLTGIY